MITIWFVDVEKGRADCRAFLEKRKRARVVAEAGINEEELVKRIVN
jgi:hypothetical protein